MSSHSSPHLTYVETPLFEIDVNNTLTRIVSGVVTSVIAGALSRYVVTPIVRKGVDKAVHPRMLEVGRNQTLVFADEDAVEAEVIEHEENADDTK